MLAPFDTSVHAFRLVLGGHTPYATKAEEAVVAVGDPPRGATHISRSWASATGSPLGKEVPQHPVDKEWALSTDAFLDANERYEVTKDCVALLGCILWWLRHPPKRDQFEDTTEFWNPIGTAEKMLGRRASTTYVAPREELISKMLLAPETEGNF